MKKTLLLTLIISALIIPAFSAEREPRHPLSQIHPVDTDFNMSDSRIYNLSSLELNDGTISGTGLVFDDYSIRDEGNNYVFRMDTTSSEFRFEGADLSLSGRKLSNVSQISTSGDGSLEIRDSVNNQDVARFNEGGTFEVPNGNIDVQGNSVTSSDGEVCIGDECS